MFLFGRKNNAPVAPASPPSPAAETAAAAVLPTAPPAPTPVCVPAVALVNAPASAPFTAPRAVLPASRRLQQRVKRLKRDLRVTGRTLARQRFAEPKPLFVLDSPLPEIVPAPVALPEPAALLPSIPEIEPPATAPVSAVAGLDEASLKALVASTPAFVEMQYELVDLRHQLQALQADLSALRAAQAQGPVPLTASQLAIVDASGQVVANVSSEGVVSCSSIVFMAQR